MPELCGQLVRRPQTGPTAALGSRAPQQSHSPVCAPAPPSLQHLPSAAMSLPGAWPAGSPAAGKAGPQRASVAGVSWWKSIMTPSRPGKAVGLRLRLQGPAVQSTGQRGPALAMTQASPSVLAPRTPPSPRSCSSPSHLVSTCPLPLLVLVSDLQSSPGPVRGQPWAQLAHPGHCRLRGGTLLPGNRNRIRKG